MISSPSLNLCRYYTCIYQDMIQLYMVLDGHDGSKAVKFAMSHIPHFLLQSELVGGGDKMVMDALRRAIVKTEREFFIGVDPYITRKVTLQFEIEVSKGTAWGTPPPVSLFNSVASAEGPGIWNTALPHALKKSVLTSALQLTLRICSTEFFYPNSINVPESR